MQSRRVLDDDEFGPLEDKPKLGDGGIATGQQLLSKRRINPSL